MIDLEEIKRHRALWAPDDSTSLPTICAHVDVLIAEVERLKNDKADIDHAYAFARNKAMLLERAAVVVWLRREIARATGSACSLAYAANTIERGEHRRKEDE